MQRDDAFRKSRAKIRTLVLGDSHHMKIMKTDLNKGVFNFATGGENYVQSYYKLKKILAEPNDIKTIIIPLNINSLAWNKFSTKEYLFYWSHYIDYLELCEIDHESGKHFVEFLRGRFFPYIGKSKEISNYIQAKVIDEEEKLSAMDQRNQDFSTLPRIEQTKIAKKRVEELFPSGYYDPTLEIYFHKLIDLSRAKNIRVIVLTLPMTDTFMNSYAVKYKTKYFDDKRTAIKSKYPDLLFVDLRTKIPDNQFSDSDHLNLYGTATVDKHLIGELRL